MQFDWKFSSEPQSDDIIVVLEKSFDVQRIVKSINTKWKSSSTCNNPYFQKDIFQNITKFCDVASLVALSKTCSYFNYLINKSDIAPLQKLLIEDATKVPVVSTEEQTKLERLARFGKKVNKTVPSLSMDLANDENFYEKYFKIMLTHNLQTKSKLLVDSQEEDARKMFQVKIRRMANFLTVRVFPLPISITSMYAKGYNISELIKETLDSFKGDVSGESINRWASDALTYRELSLQKLIPVSSIETLNTALKADYRALELKSNNPCPSPNGEEFIAFLQRILGSKKILLFQDMPFRAKGLAGLRFAAFGDRNGCIFQYEVCSNMCGGPYSMMSCGMG